MTTKKIKSGASTCEIDDLLFPVEIRNEEMACNKEYSKRVIGQINDQDFLLNQCSDVYTLVPNADIFPNIEQVLFNNMIDFDVTYSHINHVRFYADYTITDNRYGYTMKGTTDTIQPMLRVQHSYNGLTKYKIILGYFRMVCTNGLTIPVAEMKEFNLVIVGKHTESIMHSFSKLDNMLKFFAQDAKNIINKITAKYEVLGDNWIANPKERLEAVLTATKITMVDNSKFNTINDILSRIDAEAVKDGLGYNGKVNDWLIYNGINQYINDNSRNIIVPEKRMEIDSEVLEWMLKTC